MCNENEANSILTAVSSDVKTEIYKDLLQGSMREIGDGLTKTTRFLKGKLAKHLKYLSDSSAENNNKLLDETAEKLKHVPKEDIIEPTTDVVVPAMIANSYNTSEDLRHLYASLLAKAMDKKTTAFVHPAYVEIIKQLSPQEAMFLKSSTILSNPLGICDIRFQKKSIYDNSRDWILHKNNVIRLFQDGAYLLENYLPCANLSINARDISFMIDNFLRLKLISITGQILLNENAYYNFYYDDVTKECASQLGPDIKENPKYKGYEIAHIMKSTQPTSFGKRFYEICIKD